MRKLWSVVRFSSVGVFCSGILVAVQGCTAEDAVKALLIWLALALGSGAAEETITGGGSSLNVTTLTLPAVVDTFDGTVAFTAPTAAACDGASNAILVGPTSTTNNTDFLTKKRTVQLNGTDPLGTANTGTSITFINVTGSGGLITIGNSSDVCNMTAKFTYGAISDGEAVDICGKKLQVNTTVSVALQVAVVLKDDAGNTILDTGAPVAVVSAGNTDLNLSCGVSTPVSSVDVIFTNTGNGNSVLDDIQIIN